MTTWRAKDPNIEEVDDEQEYVEAHREPGKGWEPAHLRTVDKSRDAYFVGQQYTDIN